MAVASAQQIYFHTHFPESRKFAAQQPHGSAGGLPAPSTRPGMGMQQTNQRFKDLAQLRWTLEQDASVRLKAVYVGLKAYSKHNDWTSSNHYITQCYLDVRQVSYSPASA